MRTTSPTDEVSSPSAKKPVTGPSFRFQCTTGGATTVTWTREQVVLLEVRWYDSNFNEFLEISEPIKRGRPSGSGSWPTPSGAVYAEASLYDSAGTEVAGLVDRDCSDSVPA